MSDNKSPWGSGGGKRPNGGKSPWGNNGKPDRNKPRPGEASPDLENVIQGFKSRVRSGGGGGGRRGGRRSGGGGGNDLFSKAGPIGMFLVIGVIAMAVSCVYQVDQQQEAVVLRFGKYDRTAPPGLNFKLPTPFEVVEKIPARVVQKTTIGGNNNSSLMLTGDENIADIDFSVLWRINDVKNFVFEVDQPAGAVRAVAESAMREVVGKSELQKVITTDRLQTTIAVRDLMQDTLDEYQAGIEVVEVQLQKADPPGQGGVIDAFRDLVSAEQDKETKINEATRFQNDVVPKARGEAAQILQDAEAYKGRVVAEAKGEAERFNLILKEYKAAPRVTRQRMYLETIEQVYGPAEKIILDDAAGQGVVPYLPLDQLSKKKGGQ